MKRPRGARRVTHTSHHALPSFSQTNTHFLSAAFRLKGCVTVEPRQRTCIFWYFCLQFIVHIWTYVLRFNNGIKSYLALVAFSTNLRQKWCNEPLIYNMQQITTCSLNTLLKNVEKQHKSCELFVM